jgi:hypothetical protein
MTIALTALLNLQLNLCSGVHGSLQSHHFPCSLDLSGMVMGCGLMLGGLRGSGAVVAGGLDGGGVVVVGWLSCVGCLVGHEEFLD